MGIYKRKEVGTVVWWCSYTVNGQRVRESTGQTTKKEAELFLAERLVAKRIPKRQSIGVLLDGLIEDYENNEQSLEGCKQYVEKHLRPVFGDLKAERITKGHVNKWINSMRRQDYANATINRGLSMLRRAYTIADIPYPRVEKLAENNVRTGFVDDDQFFKHFEKLPKHQRPIALFAYETGCRKAEILGLTWTQLDFIRRIVRLNPGETKNKEGRVIPLSEMMIFMLHGLPRVCEFVFTYRGKRLKDIKEGWNDAQTAKGTDRLLFHDLRRSAVRNMVRAGVPERVAMAISGHKTRSIFDRYNIVDENDLTRAMKAMTDSRIGIGYRPSAAPEIKEYVEWKKAQGEAVKIVDETPF